MSNNAHELSNRLLNALDNNYNVVDMQAVNEIISILEKFNITKELLETTRLGKHVNELRRKTTDPTLARRAKVLVKRWRDLVIPTVASPGHLGSNRSSAERQVRRLGGTPLTSPALSRQVVSPAVPSPRPPSRPAWGGYESDSQDVILVDDDPPPPAPLPPPPSHKAVTPPVRRPPSPELVYDDKKAKRDKKLPRKRRVHGRAGSGTETPSGGAVSGAGAGAGVGAGAPPPGAAGALGGAWAARNGSAPERRRNGWRRDAPDGLTALATRLPPAGAKKVKTTKELLEQIQSRGSKAPPSRPHSPPSPRSPHSPDVMLIEPDPCPMKVESPMRNGGSEPAPAPEPAPPLPPLEDEREYFECTCGDPELEGEAAERADCPAGVRARVLPLHVHALHNALLPGLNGTRAPPHPHQYAVRPALHPDNPALFASVVPLYNYSDYADDYCVKNMARVPLCAHLPWTEFVPPPPEPPPAPPTPPPRPYPVDDALEVKAEPMDEDGDGAGDQPSGSPRPDEVRERPRVEAEMVTVPCLEPSERLKAPLLSTEEESQFGAKAARTPAEGGGAEEKGLACAEPEHRTVERTKAERLDGRALGEACARALRAARWRYEQAAAAPVLPRTATADEAALGEALGAAAEGGEGGEGGERDALGRPPRPAHFAEWHECARLGELIALPYVVID